MKKSQKILMIFTVAITALFSSSCFPTGSQNNTHKQTEDLLEAVNIDPLYGTPEKLTREKIPEQYEEKISDNLIISADVTVPENIDFGTVVAKSAEIPAYENQGKIVDSFLSGSVVHTQQGSADDDSGGISDIYVAPTGEKMIIRSDSIYYYGVDELDSSYFDYTPYFTNSMFLSPRMNEIYTSDELDGIDREWAVSLVKEKLEVISAETGMEFMQEPDVYCIDSASAQKFYEKTFAYTLNPDSFNFTEERNAYFIYFANSFFGLPITHEARPLEDMPIGDSYAYGIVDSEGLVRFCLSNGYIAASDKLESNGMYNVDVVKLALANKYGATQLNGLNVVTDIDLNYVCENTSSASEFVFRPCWVCYICQPESDEALTDGELTDHPTAVLFVDALTGELLNSSDAETLYIRS